MKNGTRYPRAHQALAFSLILAVAIPCGVTHAQESDPFQGPGIWKSFDRYKEEQNQKLFSELTGDINADAKKDDIKTDTKSPPVSGPTASQGSAEVDDKKTAADADAVAEPHTLDAKPVVTDAKAAEPVLAPPEHPLSAPAMPGLSARFTLPVDTTDDDIKNTPHIANIDTDTPDLQLPKQNWMDAAQAAKLHAEGKDGNVRNAPVNVRLSLLPSFKAPSPHKKIQVAAFPKPAPPPEPPAADRAACAAIDAYKKQQLEAIQSDHQTLTALQAAIKELGLQKDLSFMAGADSKMDMPENGGMPSPAAP